ncbi:MAG: hypothetical protein K1W01_04700 [Muribaculaceae bacterium]
MQCIHADRPMPGRHRGDGVASLFSRALFLEGACIYIRLKQSRQVF